MFCFAINNNSVSNTFFGINQVMRSHVRMFTRYPGSFGLLVLIHAIRSKLDNYLNLKTDWFMWYLVVHPQLATGDIHHAYAAFFQPQRVALTMGSYPAARIQTRRPSWPTNLIGVPSRGVRLGIGTQCMVWNGSCGLSGLQQGPSRSTGGSWRQSDWWRMVVTGNQCLLVVKIVKCHQPWLFIMVISCN